MDRHEKGIIYAAACDKATRIREALDKDDLVMLNNELSSAMVSSDYTELIKPCYRLTECNGEVYFMYKGVKFWVRELVDAMQAKRTDLYVITYSHRYYTKANTEVFYEQVVPDTETYCLNFSEGKTVDDEILRACDEELDKWNIEALLKEQREMR